MVHRNWISFSAATLLLMSQGASAADPAGTKTPQTIPYPLGKCIVSGEELGSMGKPVSYLHDGREIRFCCKGCIAKFQSETAKYTAALDSAIVAEQLRGYPLKTCVVSGKRLGGGDMEPVDWVYSNRLVRLCCKMCKDGFAKDPAKYLKKLDAAVVAEQKHGYPLDTCPVSRQPLGSMGKPFDYVIGGQLVRLCCPGCKGKVDADPPRYMHAIRTAKKGKAHGVQKKDGGS